MIRTGKIRLYNNAIFPIITTPKKQGHKRELKVKRKKSRYLTPGLTQQINLDKPRKTRTENINNADDQSGHEHVYNHWKNPDACENDKNGDHHDGDDENHEKRNTKRLKAQHRPSINLT